jgi:oligosaccharide reducing-end xylanase
MKKAVLISLAVLCMAAVGLELYKTSAKQGLPVVPASSDPVYAVALGQSVNCTRLLTPPILDGQPNDWPFGDTIVLDRSTAYSFSGTIDSVSDLSASVRSGWDDEQLYFLIQVTDDIIVTDSTDVWRDDGVEIGLDGLHDQYPWGSDDHQYTVVADGRIADRGTATMAITAAVLQYQGGYNVEAAIPISQLIPGTPISGTVVGFTVGLNDDDDGGNRDAYLIWQGTSTSTSPEEFGSLLFTERAEDRLAVLEARIAKLEERIRELLAVLGEFEQVTLPTLTALSATPVPTATFTVGQIDILVSSPGPTPNATAIAGTATPTPPPVMPTEATTPLPGL